MNKLNELIHKHCPDGVRFCEVGEVAHYAKDRIDAADVDENTYVGVENLLQNKMGKTLATSVPTSGVVIAFHPGNILIGNIRPYLRKIWLADCDGGTNGDVLTIQIDDEANLLPKYLYYVLSSEQFFYYDIQNCKGAKMPRGSKDAVLRYSVPVPPPAVQCEIVRILDNFTELTAKLTAKLTAEFTVKKKQYEYYRDQLLSFTGDVLQVKLGDYFPHIRNGFVGTATPFFTTEDNGIRYLKGTNIHDGIISDNDFCYITPEFHQKHIRNELKLNDILMVQSGHVGECAVVTEQYVGANCHALIIMSNGGNCSSKYVVHYLHTTEGKKKLGGITTGGTVKHILASEMKKFTIPLPPLAEQERIVSTLDRLNAHYNDLYSDLTAEIEARQRQYEYYRDKLLTFEPAK